MIEFLVLLLLGIGAIAPLWFVLDYLRTANLTLRLAKQTVTLNLAISGVLIISILRRLEIFDPGQNIWLYLQMVFFVAIDVALLSQIWILRHARDNIKDTPDKE